MRVLGDREQRAYYTGITALTQPGHPSGVRLMPRDVLIWLAMVERVNWRTGHCEMTLKRLSDDTGIPYNFVVTGMTRLKKARMAIQQYNPMTGERWLIPNPSVVWSGSKQNSVLLEKEWEAALRAMDLEAAKEAADDSEMAERIASSNRALNFKAGKGSRA